LKILLTGSNGFLGSILYSLLSKKNKIYTLATKKANFNYNLFISTPVFNIPFDLVIHAAGKAHIIPSNEHEIDEIFKNNVIGTSNLLEGLSKNLPKYFVFISSVSVYGLVDGQNIEECHPLLANDPYGKSKVEAEKIILKWCEDNNIICTILRLPLIVGSNPPGNLGKMINAINKGYYFNIDGGNAKKSMVLASDIAKFIIKAAEVGGTYNLTDGLHPTFYDLSKSISKMSGKSFVPNLPLFIAKVLAKFGDLVGNNFPINSNKLSKITSTLTFDDSKAKMAFGWNPTTVLNSFKLYDDVK
jgi:nucleoside-diphosphate-sugar epimerase